MENKNMKPNEENALTDEQLSQVSGGGYYACKVCGYHLSSYEDKTVCSMCGSQDIKYVRESINVFA